MSGPHYELQLTDEQEEKLGPITTVLKVVDGVKKKLDAISEEIDGIEKVYICINTRFFLLNSTFLSYWPVLPLSQLNHQGFLQTELVEEACRGLRKRCVAATELLMQSLESLDSIVRH